MAQLRRSLLTALAGASLVPGSLFAALEASTPATVQPTDWAQVKAQFPLTRDYTHMAGFFIVSHPTPVRNAIDGFRRAIRSMAAAKRSARDDSRPE